MLFDELGEHLRVACGWPPAPIISSGRFAAAIASTARAIAFSSATGRRLIARAGSACASRLFARDVLGQFEMHGAGPLLLRAAERFAHARRDVVGRDDLPRVFRQRPHHVAPRRRSGNGPACCVLIGFWPVIISIGMPPSCAYAAAVTRLVAPGPSVARHTPGLAGEAAVGGGHEARPPARAA